METICCVKRSSHWYQSWEMIESQNRISSALEMNEPPRTKVEHIRRELAARAYPLDSNLDDILETLLDILV